MLLILIMILIDRVFYQGDQTDHDQKYEQEQDLSYLWSGRGERAVPTTSTRSHRQ